MKKLCYILSLALFCLASCGEDEVTAGISGNENGSGQTTGPTELPYSPYPAEADHYVTLIKEKFFADGADSDHASDRYHSFSYSNLSQGTVISRYTNDKMTFEASLDNLENPKIEPLSNFSFTTAKGKSSLSMVVPDDLGSHQERYNFNEKGLLTSVTSTDNGFYAARRTFSYDDKGNLHKVTEPWSIEYDYEPYSYTNTAEFSHTELLNNASIDLNRFLLSRFKTSYCWDEYLLTGHVLFDAFDFAGKRDPNLIKSFTFKDYDPSWAFNRTIQLDFSYETDNRGRISQVTVTKDNKQTYTFDIVYENVK